MPHDGEHHWRDAYKTRRVHIDTIATPRNQAELIDVVRKAATRGQRVRVDAAGHSFSDVAVPVDVLVDPKKLKRLARVGPTRVRVETGARIRDLNRFLADEGLAMPNLGSYDRQTVPGACNTGTHGSGVELGGVPDTIRAIELVDCTGALHRLTDADGDAFHAATVGLGALGVVAAYELEVVPAYDLEETAYLADWDEVKPGLRDGTLLRSARHVEVMVSPYLWTPKKGKYKDRAIRPCLVLRKKLSTGPRRHGSRPLLPQIALLFGGITADIVLKTLRTDPQDVARLHYESCAFSQDLTPYVERSDKVLLQDVSNVPAISTEIGVPSDKAVDAVEAIFAQAHKFRGAGWWHTAPLNLRWVAASSNTLIAMYTGRETCMIEIPNLLRTPGMEAMFLTYERLLAQTVKGRPHWGKVHQALGVHYPIADLYPLANRWLDVYKVFNRTGMFSNPLTARVGLDDVLAGVV